MSDRRFERVPFALEVEFRTAGAFLVAYSTNLSKGGMFIETNDPLPVGKEVALRFNVPGEGTIEVQGVVAWVQAWTTEGRPQGMGVRFEHLDGRHGEAIDRIVGGFRGLRVIVLASETHARQVLARAVRSIVATAEVIEAADADAAEAALARQPDLAVIDLDGTEADGLLTLRLAKAGGAALPVIATARDADAKKRARELGADEVLGNPPAFPDLQAAVVRALGRPSRVR